MSVFGSIEQELDGASQAAVGECSVMCVGAMTLDGVTQQALEANFYSVTMTSEMVLDGVVMEAIGHVYVREVIFPLMVSAVSVDLVAQENVYTNVQVCNTLEIGVVT